MKQHPEQQKGEMFLTNANIEGYSQIGWKTKRNGTDCIRYKRKTDKRIVPVFVQKEEYDTGMEKYRVMGL